jgi:Domain of unknown function (DUF397)
VAAGQAPGVRGAAAEGVPAADLPDLGAELADVRGSSPTFGGAGRRRVLGRVDDGCGGEWFASRNGSTKGTMTVFENGMYATDLGNVDWRKSARSNSSGNCVQLAQLDGGQVGVRDSKDPDGPALIFSGAEAAEWIRGLKSGRYDDLITT